MLVYTYGKWKNLTAISLHPRSSFFSKSKNEIDDIMMGINEGWSNICRWHFKYRTACKLRINVTKDNEDLISRQKQTVKSNRHFYKCKIIYSRRNEAVSSIQAGEGKTDGLYCAEYFYYEIHYKNVSIVCFSSLVLNKQMKIDNKLSVFCLMHSKTI